MVHKWKKHNQRKLRSKHESNKKLKCSEDRLKQIAMSVGYHVSSPPSTSSAYAAEEVDDIVVVFDKREERIEGRNAIDILKTTLKNPNNPKDMLLAPQTSKSSTLENLGNIPLLPNPKLKERPYNKNDIVSESEADSSSDHEADSEDDCSREAKRPETLVNEYRHWEHTLIGESLLSQEDKKLSPIFSSSKSFSIMSYNVLAQQLLEMHRYLYHNHNHKALTWKFRSEVLWKEIQQADADILCLQEVQASHLDSFYGKLEDLGYKGLYKQRSSQHADGCAIYYKTNKFKFINSTTVEFSQSPPFDCLLDRKNIAIIVQLALRDSSDPQDELIVATTHLLYNPKRHDVKLAQTQVLLAELDRMSYIGEDKLTGKPNYLPMIVAGDFNLEPNSSVYKFVTEGFLRYSNLAARSLTDAFYGQVCQEHLLPFELQISHSCQHLGLLLYRFQQRSFGNLHSEEKEVPSSRISRLYNSDKYTSIEHYFKKMCKLPLLYEEDFCGRIEKGCLHHSLNLKSVYRHQWKTSTKKEVCEATTHQKDWVTVDYIFYSGSCSKPNQSKEDGPLKLLSRLSLPTIGQCQKLKSIPNRRFGSDHISLMAHFLLDAK